MNKRNMPLMGLIMLWINIAVAQENQWNSARPDGHAPISIMGDHYHKKGEVMLSYRFMPMWMNGSLESSFDISNEEIYQNFIIAPQNMQMNMHMLGGMYAPSDNFTLMVMANYITNTMVLRAKSGVEFTTQSGGLGDITIGGLVKFYNKNKQSLHGNVSMSIPTGDLDQRDATPLNENAQLAYSMQLGSGTWDPSLGVTYLGQSSSFSWGAQTKYKLRIGENSESYKLGNRLDISTWSALNFSKHISFSTSLSYFKTATIGGADEDLNPMMMPLFDSENSGRSQLDIGLGSNFYLSSGTLKNLRLAVEVQLPIYQNVVGIQMKNSLMATVGIQYTIGHH